MVHPETLGGKIVVLRPWELEDADWYVSARDEEVLRWTNEPRDLEPAEVSAAILKYRSEPGFICMAITDVQTGELLGNLALGSKASSDADISYWLAPGARGRGAATEAVKLLSDWAFTVGFERLQLRTRIGNIRSEAVALRAGFVLAEQSEKECRFELRSRES